MGGKLKTKRRYIKGKELFKAFINNKKDISKEDNSTEANSTEANCN